MKLVVLAALGVALSVGACATSPPGSQSLSASVAAKPRVVVTADPELDDSNSMLRYLLYSSNFDTEGLIYASSGVHWKGDGSGRKVTAPGEASRSATCPCDHWRWDADNRFIEDVIDVYEKAYANLRVHDRGYPTPAYLRSKVRWGNVEYVGDMSKETAGSNLIKELLLDEKPGPVYLLAWGGQSTIGRALKSIEEQYRNTPQWPAIQAKVTAKAIIQSWGDQDSVGATYIRPTWPGIRSTNMAAGVYGYGARGAVLPEDLPLLGAEWMSANISSKGPMGAHYYVWGDGRQTHKGDMTDYFGLSGLTADQLRAMGYNVWTPPQPKGTWISEGDTPTMMNLIDNGLRGYQEVSWGGWGGRVGQDIGPAGTPNNNYAAARFFATAQRDLAARFKWAVTPRYADANHEPVVRVQGPLARTARAGETVTLNGSATDPDRNPLTYRWWQYADVDTYAGKLALTGDTGPTVSFTVPADAKAGDTLHLIFEVSDNGEPKLTRYQRVIVTVAG